jgi:hypothetical protein
VVAEHHDPEPASLKRPVSTTSRTSSLRPTNPSRFRCIRPIRIRDRTRGIRGIRIRDRIRGRTRRIRGQIRRIRGRIRRIRGRIRTPLW